MGGGILAKRIFRAAWCAVLVVVLAAGCNRRDPVLVSDVNPGGWNSGESHSVEFLNEDTVSLRELSVFVVHRQNIARNISAIPLVIAVTTPDSLTYSEEWVFYPDIRSTEETVVWYETKHVYRRGVKLAQPGRYGFSFSHGLPGKIEGVRAIGLEIK